eukprot:COSAG04_NODE_1522_length_6466_cov_5.303720_7_plen_77_part_00
MTSSAICCPASKLPIKPSRSPCVRRQEGAEPAGPGMEAGWCVCVWGGGGGHEALLPQFLQVVRGGDEAAFGRQLLG